MILCSDYICKLWLLRTDNLGIWEDAGYEVNKNVKMDKNIDFLICPQKGGQIRTSI